MEQAKPQKRNCNKCGKTKPVGEFYATSDGRYCKSCTLTYQAKYRAAHPETRWHVRFPEKAREVSRRWGLENQFRRTALEKTRKAAKLKATPSWANKFFISEAYDLAARRSRAFGFAWHVDHIVPLRSKLVCGLHVHNNLRVIPGQVNVIKGNRQWPDMADGSC